MASKLVRDRIPEIIAASGKIPQIHIANNEEFSKLLKDKLLEECQEFLESEKPEELADILEVVDAIRASIGISEQELSQIKQNKFTERGGFAKKIILDD